MPNEKKTERAKPRRKRKKLLNSPRIQFPLAVHALLYWLSCIVTVQIIRVFLDGPGRQLASYMGGEISDRFVVYAPPLLASIFFVPVVLYDVIRLTNRFVGPMERLKQRLVMLADGHQQVQPIHFRKGDLWHDFAEAFNGVLARVQRLENDNSAKCQPEESTVA